MAWTHELSHEKSTPRPVTLPMLNLPDIDPKADGFGAMRPSDRSYAVALHESLQAIEQWRATLPDKQRRRLRGAQQNVKRWRKATGAKSPVGRDDVAAALAAWRCFVSRVRALPAEQAAPVWQAALAEVAAMAI